MMNDLFNLKMFTLGENLHLHDYRNWLGKIICSNPNMNCYIGKCENYPITTGLENFVAVF